MHARFETIAGYAVNTGADGISSPAPPSAPALSVAIKHAQCSLNEAMTPKRLHGGSIGLIASLEFGFMPPEFPVGTDVRTALVADAMEALNRGDMAHHDALIVAASKQLAAQGAQVIALAQFSMARAASAVAAATGLPVLTTPDSGIRLLRARLNA